MSDEQNNNAEEITLEDFDVIFASKTDDGTIIATSSTSWSSQQLSMALSAYDPENKKYSAYLNEGISPSSSLSIEEIDELSTNTQNDLSKVLKINAYNRKLINKNDIVGKTVESIETNINTETKLIYGDTIEGRNRKKKLDEAKSFIKSTNDIMHIKRNTRNAISTAYVEGNWIAYLRHDNPDNYKIDVYPLGVCEIADYDINGEPVILFDINNLRTRLGKTYKKNKKNKALFFSTIDEEVKANYPQEVYEAFIKKEKYAILDHKYTGVIRVNNLNRRYGVSPILRAYPDINMLETFAEADRVNSKARAKKIIHQTMNKEIMGQSYDRDYFPEMAYAHKNFMDSWKQPTVVVTSPPSVKDIKYVEPKVEMTSKDSYNIYRSKVLATLGIQFLMDTGSQSVSTASISVTQLMRTINAISEQLEDVYKKWYRQILLDNGFPIECTPDVHVIDSEQLENTLKKDFATLLYGTLNASLETCYSMIGLDVNDEAEKRKSEADKGYDDIFKPRQTAYTNPGDNNDKGGRPELITDENQGKNAYDKTYNKEARVK